MYLLQALLSGCTAKTLFLLRWQIIGREVSLQMVPAYEGNTMSSTPKLFYNSSLDELSGLRKRMCLK